MSDIPRALPRHVRRDTALVDAGRASAVIVYPPCGGDYTAAATRLADVIERCTGVRLDLIADTGLLPRRNSRLPDDNRNRTMILLGNINTNRVLVPLYARYYCASDATYPGPGGYEVRTLVNPYGTRTNSILLGGSDAAGVRRAVERLATMIERSGRQGDLSIPFTLDVSLAPPLAQQLAERSDTRLDAPMPQVKVMLLTAVGLYAIAYAWSGDPRYGVYARDCLRALNQQYDDSYGDWHYAIEKIVRAVPWLSAGGFLDDADLLRTDQLLLGTALGTQDMWWRMSNGKPPLGHRHHGKGTFAFYLQARYLLDHAVLNDAGRQLCERWVSECREFLDALARARVDDQDDESTLNNQSTLVWYALGEERFDLFESCAGYNAWLMAQRAIALHDNMGAGAGIEGYGEGLTGAMYMPQEAGLLVAASAFYYQDGQLKWIRRRIPNLETPLRWDGWSLSPPFMHKFDSGDELIPQAPDRLTGLRLLPISPYQAELMHHPPRRLHNQGHFVDAPEVWQAQGGVGATTLPQSRMFDKLVVRGGFDPGAPYLLLQGYHGGYRWQGSMHSVNAIVRFSQFGHIFLIQNTDRQSYLHKNGLLISDGYNDIPISPVGECLVADDFPKVALSATRVNEYHHASWTRYLFWLKAGYGMFVVMDSVQIERTGPYSLTLTWRTPGFAELGEHAWQTRQGDHVFCVRWNHAPQLSATHEEQGVQGAANPYVLRQVQAGDYPTGERVTFHNVFYAHPSSVTPRIELVRLSSEQCLLTDAGTPAAWCAIDPQQRGLHTSAFEARAASVLATASEITLAGACRFATQGIAGWRIDSEHPVGIYLDLAECRGLIRAESPESHGAQVSVQLREQHVNYLAGEDPCVLALPAADCAAMRVALAQQFTAWSQQRDHAMPPDDSDSAIASREPDIDWRFDRWQPVQERLRAVTVTSNPLPLDGYADQLVDTVTPETRTLSKQWPDAPQYDIRLELAEAQRLDSVRIVGDSREVPTLRVFHPLPEGIEVSVSSDGFQVDERACDPLQQRETYIHRRFYAAADPMEAVRIPIQQSAKQIHVRVPRPPGGAPLVLHEIEVYGAHLCAPRVSQLTSVDLDDDGVSEFVATSAAGEVVVLGHDGAEHWRWRSPFPITHLSCHNLDGDGRRQVCVCTLNREVRIFAADGRLRQVIALPAFQEQGKVNDVHIGTMQAVNSIAVWHREPDGRGALVLGCYGLLVFLDPAGEMLGHSFVDGAWVTDLLAVPGQGAFDLWARTRWNHGVNIYRGIPGLAHSGAFISFGGVRQGLFRPCERVLPFVTGDRVGFEQVEHAGASYLFSANENGFGVLVVAARDWVWKVEGGAPVTACCTAEDAGEPVVLIGGADGFVSAFGLVDGQPKRRMYTGAPVTGIVRWPSARDWGIGTRKGLIVAGADWKQAGIYPSAVDQVCAVGPCEVVVAQPDGTLVKMTLNAS